MKANSDIAPEIPEADFNEAKVAFEESLGSNFGTASILEEEEEAPTLTSANPSRMSLSLIHISDQDKTELTELCEGYKSFLSQCKTERLATKRAIELASAAGYVPLTEAIAEKRALKPGDKIWIDNYGKAIMLVQIGTNDIEAGVNILGAHIDSPRLDLKQNPLYEASDFVLLDTHYYGGIKNYQWVALPLALKGVVAKKDGTVRCV